MPSALRQVPQNARGVCDLLTVSGPQHAFFSALQPGTHVIAHTGPTNKKLRCHLPLTGVKGSRLRVGGDTREQAEGTCYVFDDSFEHEAWHDGDSTRCLDAPWLETALQRLDAPTVLPGLNCDMRMRAPPARCLVPDVAVVCRIVLIFDVWHPDFSDEEVKFLSYLQKSQMKEEVSCQSLSKCARIRPHACMRQHGLAQHRASAAARHRALMRASMRQRQRLPR